MTTTMIGRQMSMLIIQSVDYQHSGTYTCRAENPAGITTYSTELKVNGNLTGALRVFYLQRNLILFLSPLVERQLIKENLLNFLVL